MLHVQLLGRYTIAIRDQPLPPLPTEKSRGLFAYLVLHPGPHRRARLVGLFWPDLPEKSARRRLTQELWRINSELGKAGVDGFLSTSGATVARAADVAITCDALQLHDALNRLRQDEVRNWPTVDELTSLYQGDLLPGFYEDWVLLARERLFQALCQGLARLLAHHKQMGGWDEARTALDALLLLDPLADEWVREAMHLAQSRNRPEAGLRHYERYVARLAADLDATPAPDLTVLAQRLAGQRGPRSTPPATFADPTYQPPLMGRDEERALLLDALDQAQAGQGQICLLEGAAGVGKSRLLETLLADARWRGLPAGRGAGQEIQRDDPYAPLIQALDDLLTPLRAQQVQVLLDPIWPAVAAQIYPALATWLPDLPDPPPLDPEPARVRLLEALTRLILALGQLAPTVLVLDDLQWADSATLSALIYLARRVADSPLLLFLAYRSEEARADGAVWVSLAEIDRSGRPRRLQLEGLSPEETGALVRRILDLKQPAPLFERRIYSQTQGNPFFVLETLRTLYQEANLTPTADGGWQTPWDSHTVDYQEAFVAPEVDAMIRRRLRHLLPAERRVLDVVSVLGTDFDLSLLVALDAGAPRAVLAATSTLVQRRFLQETATAYRFEHDQIRQTVYAQLPDRDRRQLHRRIGETLARLRPDAYTLLAHHFEQAAAHGQALRYHRLAGDAAQAGGSYPLARRHYGQAVAWLDHVTLSAAARVDLLLAWESTLDLLGERETQAQVLARLAAQEELSPAQRGVLALRQARFEGASGHLTAAMAAVAACVEPAARLDDVRLQIESLIQWGQWLHQVGDLAAAEDKLRRAVALAGEMPEADPRVQAQALIALADVLPARNAYAEALAGAESARQRYQALGDLAGEAHANLSLAVIQMERGDVVGAVARYTQALTLTEQCGYRTQEARIASNMANALCVLGRIGEALAIYQRGLTIGRELGNARVEHVIAVNYGSTYLSFVGADQEVIAQVRRALAWSEEVGDQIGVGQAWNLLSMAAYYAGDLPLARQHLDRSVAAFADLDYAYIKAQALRAQATLSHAEGNFDDALHLISAALAVSQEIDAPHLVTEMRSIQGELFLDLGRLDEALAATTTAVDAADPNVFQSYLLHHRHFRVLRAAGREDDARTALARAVDEFNAILASLSPEQQARSRAAIPAHRALLADEEFFL